MMKLTDRMKLRISLSLTVLALVFVLMSLQTGNAQTATEIRRAEQLVEVAERKYEHANRAVYLAMAALAFCPPTPACAAPAGALVLALSIQRIAELELRHARENLNALRYPGRTCTRYGCGGGGGRSGGR